MTAPIETLEFQSEARQLLQLMIHSIYSNKDTFLRELVSNASDALDKLRLESYRDKDLEADTADLHIAIETDPEARTLTVRDNGIGMTREEVVALIGTIAKSGTADFLTKLKEAKDAAASQDLIGQFGVGFYASFMVADKVTLVTRRAGTAEGVRWESTGEGTYTIQPVEDAPQGTAVTLHLKPEDTEDHLYDYTSAAKIREIVKKYSDFITWPIRMRGDGEDAEVETVNSMKALWARSSSEVSEDEYHEFYKHVSHDWQDPLETIRLQAEGTFEYQALLFLPSHAPMDLFLRERKRGVQLYVKRVFIMDDCESLVPEYLRFVKGVVDAQDLSLNVSREILQQDRQIQLIRRRLVKKVLSTVKTMMTADAEKYATFWREFGRAVKEGLLDDFENREVILEISSFASTHDAEKPTSLRDYVERMKDGQQHIYYMTGESRSAIENSPHMEAFRAKGFEVLVLTDPIDEMWVDSVPGFDGKQFQSIAKGQVDLESEEDKKATEVAREQQNKDFESLLTWLGTALGETVKEVRLSSRLTTSPACIVGDTHDLTPTLEKMYRAMGQELPPIKRILELNPEHGLVRGLREAHASRPDDEGLAETAELLYGMALLAEGGELADPSRFIKLLAGRLEKTL
ncbi:molecular chaperone HtpG [Amycolatopsis mediterranei]|uniref:Chaperone protein HtpG n=1 Tax=Amycolatopsis mediterranei (strain S699) TaxID=713604 RepID=A0A9R0NYC8_AMYMS|nr:molecular chaperone HtpG [Amycolatopsis mediterranei]AEK42805.1 heat shock protein 90 [Amycolatopsis mediterranei S699]KDO05555.1 heat shock protein 90 [Amycolatopsis mediterranei]KDU87949.1 heat shock protein 90 [Amycolatopsis mediterranei]UZF71284.1 molecular chaperone HtpG [Amycolatopsis mediterranei]